VERVVLNALPITRLRRHIRAFGDLFAIVFGEAIHLRV
jgi:hypothetical protein